MAHGSGGRLPVGYIFFFFTLLPKAFRVRSGHSFFLLLLSCFALLSPLTPAKM